MYEAMLQSIIKREIIVICQLTLEFCSLLFSLVASVFNICVPRQHKDVQETYRYVLAYIICVLVCDNVIIT